MRVIVNQDRCEGHGLCYIESSELFDLCDGKAVVLVDEVPDRLSEVARRAALVCPERAIEVVG
ncbi:MAG: ferredoxin [Pseudonocardiaceae bacterium]